ncbi:hypothetical protein BH24PSE2_BH24PSE2_10260 [soil metagenome]
MNQELLDYLQGMDGAAHLLWLGLFAALLISVVVWITWRRGRPRREERKALKKVGAEVASGILLPNGMGGQIHVDCLLLTATGLLVLDVKDIRGVIFGSDRMDEWAVFDGDRRYTFQNPQSALYDRVAAVKLLAGETPVSGRIAFTSLGRFTKGMPTSVIMLEALEQEFGNAREARREIQDYRDSWQQVMRAATRA